MELLKKMFFAKIGVGVPTGKKKTTRAQLWYIHFSLHTISVFFYIFGGFCVLNDPESTENGRGQKKTKKT